MRFTICLLVSIVAGCSNEPSVSGRFMAVTTGFISIPYVIKFAEGGAEFGVGLPNGKVVSQKLSVQFKDGLLLAKGERPGDILSFRVLEGATKLECTNCKGIGLPRDWDKQPD